MNPDNFSNHKHIFSKILPLSLIDISVLQKYDVKEMYKVYDIWPQIARQQFESNLEPISFDNVSHMVFAGMGGSGSINDIFSSIFSSTKIHIDIVKGYHFPKTVVPESVVIVTSVSGNTAESLSVLKSATNLECKIIAFSSGRIKFSEVRVKVKLLMFHQVDHVIVFIHSRRLLSTLTK